MKLENKIFFPAGFSGKTSQTASVFLVFLLIFTETKPNGTNNFAGNSGKMLPGFDFLIYSSAALILGRPAVKCANGM